MSAGIEDHLAGVGEVFHARFRTQPVSVILELLDAVFDAHLEVSARGLVAVDLYDGCLLYTRQLCASAAP